MRKTSALLLCLLLLLCAGCGKSRAGFDSSAPVSDESSVSEKPAPRLAQNPLSGLTDMDPSAKGQRPVSIMINNIKISLPQRGLSRADLYYEVLAEGGITRIMALFADRSQIPDVGSVRSARHYFLALSAPHNAIFVHFGGSPLALQTIKERSLDTINGLTLSNVAFYRDKNRIGKIPIEHTVFTDAALLEKGMDRKKIQKSGDTPQAFRFGDNSELLASGAEATELRVPFSAYDVATFTYHAADGTYQKGEFGQAQIDGTTGEPLSVKNVFILRTDISKLNGSDNPSRIDVDLSSGSGYYACDGKLIPIRWKKGAFQNQLKYYTEDGQELVVKAGKSWVCIISNANTVTYQ